MVRVRAHLEGQLLNEGVIRLDHVSARVANQARLLRIYCTLVWRAGRTQARCLSEDRPWQALLDELHLNIWVACEGRVHKHARLEGGAVELGKGHSFYDSVWSTH